MSHSQPSPATYRLAAGWQLLTAGRGPRDRPVTRAARGVIAVENLEREKAKILT